MKTTIDISNPLLIRSKEVAAEEGITLRELVEQALTDALSKREQSRTAFRLQDTSVSGDGLRSGVGWELPRELAYDDVR